MIVYPSSSTFDCITWGNCCLGDADVCARGVQPPCEWAVNADSLRPVVNCQSCHQLVSTKVSTVDVPVNWI